MVRLHILLLPVRLLNNSRNRPPLNLLPQQPNPLPTNLQLLVLPPQNRLLPTPN